MIIQEFKNTFDNNVIFVHEFLRANKRWVFVFCEIWIIQHQTIEKLLNFFKITRAYKNTYENFLKDEKSIKETIETITLQKVDQNQIDFHICTKNDNQKEKNKHKDKFCICDQIHLFS
jgi:RAB protein geranylgeranyltransferase component A